MRAGLTFSVVGSLFDPGAPRRSSLGLDGADETGLPRTESPSPVFARVRVGALDAARPDRRAVTVFVDRKTGCGEEGSYFSVVHQSMSFFPFRPRTVSSEREMATGCGVEPAAIHIIKQI